MTTHNKPLKAIVAFIIGGLFLTMAYQIEGYWCGVFSGMGVIICLLDYTIVECVLRSYDLVFEMTRFKRNSEMLIENFGQAAHVIVGNYKLTRKDADTKMTATVNLPEDGKYKITVEEV